MIFRLAHSSSHFQRMLFLKLEGRILKADIDLFTYCYGSYSKNCKRDKKAIKTAIN